MGNTQKCLRLPTDRVTTAGGLTCFKRDGEAARGDGVADALHRCDRFADTSCCHAPPPKQGPYAQSRGRVPHSCFFL